MCALQTPESDSKKLAFTTKGYSEDLKKMFRRISNLGIKKVRVQERFETMAQMDSFVKVLNRESHEQIVSNEFVVSYFRSEKGKMTRVKQVRNENFSEMAQLNFMTTYKAHIFLKNFAKVIRQLEHEYQYQLVLSTFGLINVYMQHDTEMNKMFLNTISDLRRKLHCIEVKDSAKVEKIVHSLRLQRELEKCGIHHEVWHRANSDKTLMLYSDQCEPKQMSQALKKALTYDVTVLKFLDEGTSYRLNCMVFELLVRQCESQVQNIRQQFDVDIEFNFQKLSIVIHNVHPVFLCEIKEQLEEVFQKITLVHIKGKQFRCLHNHISNELKCPSLRSLYSKQMLCLCIARGNNNLRKRCRDVFAKISPLLNCESYITVSWAHLKELATDEQLRSFSNRFMETLSSEKFSIENFEGLHTYTDHRAVLTIKELGFQITKPEHFEFAEVLTNLVLLENKKIGVKDSKTSIQMAHLNQSPKLMEEGEQSEQISEEEHSFSDESQVSICTDKSGESGTMQEKEDLQQNMNISQLFLADPKQIDLKALGCEFESEEHSSIWKRSKRVRSIEYQLLEDYGWEATVNRVLFDLALLNGCELNLIKLTQPFIVGIEQFSKLQQNAKHSSESSSRRDMNEIQSLCHKSQFDLGEYMVCVSAVLSADSQTSNVKTLPLYLFEILQMPTKQIQLAH